MIARMVPPAVLVADAEPFICRVFEAKLTKNNEFQVVCATTGSEALQQAERQDFDVLLWDMRLRNTADFLPRLRALCPNAALLLMTTDDRPILGGGFERLDIVQTLTKPFGLDTLTERVRAALAIPAYPSATARIELTEVGQQVTLTAPNGECTTRVLSAGQDTFAVVAAPRVAAPAAFVPGLRVRVLVHGPDALYTFASRLLRLRSTPVPCWILQMPRNILREQRRKHNRLPLRLQAVVTKNPADILPEVNPAEEQRVREIVLEEQTVRGTVDDLSLGGCALISDRELPVGADVALDLRYSNQEHLEGMGRIVRIQPLLVGEQDTTLSRYRIAIEFTELGLDARDRLRLLLAERE